MPHQSTRSTVSRQCLRCGKDFFPIVRQIKKGLGTYCSRACSATVKNGKPPPVLTLEQRFWRHVTKDGPVPIHRPELGPCWLWTGSIVGDNGGKWPYGKLGPAKSSFGKVILAHRLSHELHIGPIPAGLQVLHKCDFPRCVNPAHLFAGTPNDNTHDMMEKNRHPGIKLSRAKVDDARRRRTAGETLTSLAKELGVKQQTLRNAIVGRTWR